MPGQEGLSSAKSKKPRFFYGYVVVVAAFFIFMVLNGTMYSFGVFFKPLSEEFGWTRAMTSGAFSLFQFSLGLFFLVTGRLNDRFGPRVLMTVCGFLLGLSYLLMSQIGAVWQLYFFYGVVSAMGMSGGLVPLPSTVARWFVRRRGIMTGIAVSGVGVGTTIVPPVASQLIAGHGWRNSYLAIGVAALVLIVLAAQFLRRDPAQKGQSPYGADELDGEGRDLKARGFSLEEAIRTGKFWMLFVMYFCFGFTVMSVMAHIVPHATDLGISAIVAASILAIIGGVSVAGRIGIGSASDRIGSKLSLIIGFVLLALAFFWLLLVTREVWMFYLFAIIFGLAYGIMAALISLTVAEFFGLRAHGAILSGIVFANGFGGATGPLVTGWIFDMASSYYLAFLVCAVLSVTALTLALLLKPIRQEALNTKREA